MKSRKPLTAIIIAVVIFLAFVITTRFYIRQQVDLVSVVAAADNIPPRTEIKPENLTVVDVPRGVVPDGAAPRVDIFAEEKYFTKEIGLHRGEILTKSKVGTQEEIAHSDALGLNPGETIIGVQTDLTRSAGGTIYPGSRVRALAYIPPKTSGWQGETEPSRVEVIFDNLRVVGVINSDGEDASEQESRSSIPAVVTLAITPEQEKVLVRYQEEQGYSIWFTVLPENYEPVPLEDYYYRVEAGIEEQLHEGRSILDEQEPVTSDAVFFDRMP